MNIKYCILSVFLLLTFVTVHGIREATENHQGLRTRFKNRKAKKAQAVKAPEVPEPTVQSKNLWSIEKDYRDDFNIHVQKYFDAPDSSMQHLPFERQTSLHCGKHAVNNFLQLSIPLEEFKNTASSLHNTVAEMAFEDSSESEFNDSAELGNFSIEVLIQVLGKFGYNVSYKMQTEKAHDGLLLNFRRHWTSIQMNPPIYFDSNANTPIKFKNSEMVADFVTKMGSRTGAKATSFYLYKK